MISFERKEKIRNDKIGTTSHCLAIGQIQCYSNIYNYMFCVSPFITSKKHTYEDVALGVGASINAKANKMSRTRLWSRRELSSSYLCGEQRFEVCT